MKVVILAGGFGTRLSEYTDTIPKPMVPIGNMPIIEHVMEIYASYGHKEFFIALANNSGLTLHIKKLNGTNSHHIVEACFKAFARALRMSTELDTRRGKAIPSSKGVLEQAGGEE